MILEKETNGNCSNSFSSGKNHDQIWKCQLLAHGDGTNENHEQILKHKSKFRIYFLFFVFKETQFGSGSFTFPYTLVGIIFSLISISCFFFFLLLQINLGGCCCRRSVEGRCNPISFYNSTRGRRQFDCCPFFFPI
jgi:hypothetical protein